MKNLLYFAWIENAEKRQQKAQEVEKNSKKLFIVSKKYVFLFLNN